MHFVLPSPLIHVRQASSIHREVYSMQTQMKDLVTEATKQKKTHASETLWSAQPICIVNYVEDQAHLRHELAALNVTYAPSQANRIL